MSGSHGSARYIRANGVTIALREWGSGPNGPLLMLPGTGLSAALFAASESLLGGEWHGYSMDRRGQGLSEKPETGYEFSDFADDLAGVADALALEDAVAIGHSGGGTDLLLAAGTHTRHWRRIAVIEPTVQDPRRPLEPPGDPAEVEGMFERARRRRPAFESLEVAFERFRTNPSFERCDAGRVREYLAAALEPQEDGCMALRCPPLIEATMNAFVKQAMDHRYRPGDGAPDPFAVLQTLPMPVLVATTGNSGDIYREMAKIAVDVIPGAEHRHYPALGHLVPLESPETMVEITDWLRS